MLYTRRPRFYGIVKNWPSTPYFDNNGPSIIITIDYSYFSGNGRSFTKTTARKKIYNSLGYQYEHRHDWRTLHYIVHVHYELPNPKLKISRFRNKKHTI